jgi:uncharacterized protein YbbK (DUF523 family)
MKKILCSACLLGVNCRYDGKNTLNKKIIKLAKKAALFPVCPEQLGGQTTPRYPAEMVGKKILEKDGTDVTKNFKKGAQETLRIAKLYDIKKAIFKQRSPSCGLGQIYDGTFSGKVTKGDGITTSLLLKNGIKVISEEDL